MEPFSFSLQDILYFANVLVSSTVVILAFSLLAYTLTYNFLNPVARRFAFLLGLVMIVYAADVALTRVISLDSAGRWLRFQWLGIALLPYAYHTFSNAVLRTTNYRTGLRRWISLISGLLSALSAFFALFTDLLVSQVNYEPPISYLEAGPLFWPFATFFGVVTLLSLQNIRLARSRCLTPGSRQRLTYLLLGFMAPGIGTFPYLIALGRHTTGADFATPIFGLSILGNGVVAAMLVVMAYTVAYFGVLTPDRVVRYRLLRFFTRGPIVAILVILAVQTLPTVERILGLPRDIVLFSVITGVIVTSQLILSVTKSLVDRVIYREDREEIVWLRELDRRLLTTTDLRQFLENHLTSLCELLRVPAGFVAATVGPELLLEAVVGPGGTRESILQVQDWSDTLNSAVRIRQPNGVGQKSPPAGETPTPTIRHFRPIYHAGFWVWPLVVSGEENGGETVMGILGIQANSQAALFTNDEQDALNRMVERIGLALMDRKLQKQVFVALRRIIPGIDRIQEIRGLVPYGPADPSNPSAEVMEPSPVHNPEFESWVKDALSHYWGGPKLNHSPLIKLRVVNRAIEDADDNPTKALRLVLGRAIENMRPEGKPELSTPEWLLYNILEMRFIQGRKVREIAERLAISESDLYRKQRIAIGQVARALTEMEQIDWETLITPLANGEPKPEKTASLGERLN
ncbi:MAG: histidine kinase N-terminal 7TM domain-containing protein [Caldilineaceae bacterium]